jgi:hypothetical protein
LLAATQIRGQHARWRHTSAPKLFFMHNAGLTKEVLKFGEHVTPNNCPRKFSINKLGYFYR